MNIDDLIYLQNPWFRDPAYVPYEDNLLKRDVFRDVVKDVKETRQVVSIVGLRRVGKSTLLKQVIAHLLKEGSIRKEDVFYFSFDQPTVISSSQTLENVINFYIKSILHKDLHKISDKKYLFFDEIQLIPYWSDVLKRYYDLTNHFKFTVSGSTSLFIQGKSKESLAGRIFEIYMPPLSFSEYKRLSERRDIVSFLDFGQFPELLEFKDNNKKIEYLKEGVIGKVLEHDIPKNYGVRKTLEFERLFWSLLANTGQIIESGNLMSELALKKATFFKYLLILEKSLLTNKILNLSGSFRSEKRLLRKLYPASSNFLTLMPEPMSVGFKAETYVCSVLKSVKKEVFLYNHRGKEVDFVLPGEKVAIEVKYKERINPKNCEFLENFIKKANFKGIVVSKSYKDLTLRKNLVFVPLSEFDTYTQNTLILR
mgnify:CR=1 FL=1